MQCPKCQTEYSDRRKFCSQCGERLFFVCPNCGYENSPADKYCGECGERVERIAKSGKNAAYDERKYVSVLFSDLCGYTAMSARLDPEEVKEIMSRIFGEIAQVVAKYEGFIEKFVGDAVMALFGVPRVHEDDAVRAIKAAKEIHNVVEGISSRFEGRLGRTLLMHSGINTGLVVTGEMNFESGTHGITGEAINLAARLQGLAGAGEILVGPDTYQQTEGHFTFQTLQPTKLRGAAGHTQVYKVLTQKDKPVTLHRVSGPKAEFIGRKTELAELKEAVKGLREAKGKVFSIRGDVGTGKSRLVEEFKASLDLNEIRWIDGHAYAYAQNIPYFPLVDLLNGVFLIREGDPSEKVREKIESGIEQLTGGEPDIVPYLGSLYTLSYPELENVTPEFWKSRLQAAVVSVLSALARRAPTVFCLEDLHWADPSFVDLLRHALLEIRQPAVVLCVYRLAFTLFTNNQLMSMDRLHKEIRLQDLTPAEARDMLESLFKTESIPTELNRLIQGKAEGNPFYLEELVNAMIESGTLVSDKGRWKVARPLERWEISSTIHGVITGRLDRLEKDTKRILQEASVIGRTFFYEILKRVTEVRGDIDQSLRTLEQYDLIRTEAVKPEREYIFKHALTQDVAYNLLLKRERQRIHEEIAKVVESLFQERLPEFYETLAYHFRNGHNAGKAVHYLVKSGEKSLSRYSVEESHQYFSEAFEIISKKPEKTTEEIDGIVDLLNKWFFVFYYRGDYRTMPALLAEYQCSAESLEDKSKLGLFYCWRGAALFHMENVTGAYAYLKKALHIGEQLGNKKVIAYACGWLTWTCAELGLLDEAILCGQRSKEMARFLESDDFYCLSLAGTGQAHWYKGDTKRTLESGETLLAYSQKTSNVRGMVLGTYLIGCSHFMSGGFSSAIECYQRAILLSADPYYSQWPRMLLCLSYVSNGQYQEAEGTLQELLNYTRDFGVEIIGTPANSILGIILIGKGNLGKGMKIYEKGRQTYMKKDRRWCYALSEYILGTIYLEVLRRKGLKSIPFAARNVFYILRNFPFLSKKSEDHFRKSIEIAGEIGAKTILGMAYLNLGLLHKLKGRTSTAIECISEAEEVFGKCGAEDYLKRAREALASLP
jgi:class 3 adenylate cyclase/tetratricopeptide (TPR) repeat protein